jgi:hypothetical protein
MPSGVKPEFKIGEQLRGWQMQAIILISFWKAG